MKPTTEVLLHTPKFDVVRLRRQSPGGCEVVRTTIQHPGAVTIIPLVDQRRVCLIRNYRAAVDETLIELPAGTREPAEDPSKTAARELTEETGYRAGNLRHLHSFNMSPGILNERMELYLATDLTSGPPAREPNEEIENYVVPWSEAIALAVDGRIHDAKTLVGLLFYDRLLREM